MAVLPPFLYSVRDHHLGEPLPGQLVTHLLVRRREPVDTPRADLDTSQKLVIRSDGDIDVR